MNMLTNKLQFVFFTSLLICTFFTSRGQAVEGSQAEQNLNNITQRGSSSMMKTFDNRYEGVHGSPFYNEEWVKGDILTNYDKVHSDVRVKYNAYEDELLMRKGTSAIYVIKEQIKEFTLKPKDTQEVRFVKLKKYKKEEISQFYKVVYEGSLSVYEEVRGTFVKADYTGGYSAQRPYDDFKISSVFFYKSTDSDGLTKLKNSCTQVVKSFPDKNSEMKKYVQNNEFDCKLVRDIVRVFTYYDSL